jgi:hypothetical protein
MTTRSAEPGERTSVLKNALSALVGVVVMLVVYSLANGRGGEQERPFELPQAAILVDGCDFDKAENRKVFSDFALLLRSSNLVGTSSIAESYAPPWGDKQGVGAGRLTVTKLLVPTEAGKPPKAITFQTLTDAEWAEAKNYFRHGDWIAGRLLSPDGTSAIMRLAPGDPRTRAFEPDTKNIVGQAMKTLESGKFKQPLLYSRALGLTGEAERNAINATFGVQTTWVQLTATQGDFVAADQLKHVLDEANTTRAQERKFVRSYTTPASWVRYYWGVKMKSQAELDAPTDDHVREALEFARREGINPFVTPKGNVAIVDIGTEAEGEDLERLTFRIAQPLSAIPNVKVFFYSRK